MTRESIVRHWGKDLNTDDTAKLLDDLDKLQTDPLKINADEDYKHGKQLIMIKFGLGAQATLGGTLSGLLRPSDAERLVVALDKYYRRARELRQAGRSLEGMPDYARQLMGRYSFDENPKPATAPTPGSPAATPAPLIQLPAAPPKTGRKPNY